MKTISSGMFPSKRFGHWLRSRGLGLQAHLLARLVHHQKAHQRKRKNTEDIGIAERMAMGNVIVEGIVVSKVTRVARVSQKRSQKRSIVAVTIGRRTPTRRRGPKAGKARKNITVDDVIDAARAEMMVRLMLLAEGMQVQREIERRG